MNKNRAVTLLGDSRYSRRRKLQRTPEAVLDYITLYARRLLGADTVAINRLQAETNLFTIQVVAWFK